MIGPSGNGGIITQLPSRCGRGTAVNNSFNEPGTPNTIEHTTCQKGGGRPVAKRGHNWSFEWGGQRNGQQEYVPSVRSLAPSDTGLAQPLGIRRHGGDRLDGTCLTIPDTYMSALAEDGSSDLRNRGLQVRILPGVLSFTGSATPRDQKRRRVDNRKCCPPPNAGHPFSGGTALP